MSIHKQISRIVINMINKYIICINEYEADLELLKFHNTSEFQLLKLDVVNLDKIQYIYLNEIDKDKLDLLSNKLMGKENQIFVVVDNQKRICGIFSLSYKDTLVMEINRFIHLRKNQFYLFDDYTFLEHRGRGVQKFSIKARCAIAKEDGYKKAIVLVDKNNTISRRTYENLGFKCIAKYYFLNICCLVNLVLKVKVPMALKLRNS